MTQQQLGIYQKSENKCSNKTRTGIFKAALPAIANRHKQPKRPSTDILNMLICTMDYYLATKRMKYWWMLKHRWTLKTLHHVGKKKGLHKGHILISGTCHKYNNYF